MGCLPRSFRRSTSLSDPPFDSLVFLFCLFFPRTVSLRPCAYIYALLFFSYYRICFLPPAPVVEGQSSVIRFDEEREALKLFFEMG
jgi:hypothetical protein